MNFPNSETYIPCECVCNDYNYVHEKLFKNGFDIPKWLLCKNMSPKEIQWTFEKLTPFVFKQIEIKYEKEIDQAHIILSRKTF